MFDRIVLVGAGRTSRSVVERLARIAPLAVIDLAPGALDTLSTRAVAPGAEGHPISTRVADGTSRLVLSDLRGDPTAVVAIVIAPGDDRAALESCKLAIEAAYKPVVVVVNDRDVARQCEDLGASALVRAELVGQLVEQSLQQVGLGISSAIGFGRGELVEFRVMPSSPAIGVSLASLRADGWRVAAIYRGDDLVLPTGATTIAADDRVLIIGDPKQLPHVGESLRVGIPTFPLLHGPNVVVYLPRGHDATVEDEAELIATRTRAARLVRALPGTSTRATVLVTPLPDGTSLRKAVEFAEIDGQAIEAHLPVLSAKRPGVVVAKVHERTAVDVVLGRGGRDARLCNELGVPVLFAKGTARYERVVFCVTDGEGDLGAAEVALDLARMFEVPFHVHVGRLPAYLQTPEEKTEKLIETIAQRARLHGLQPEIARSEGNPIARWQAAIARNDLAVIARLRSQRDSFSRPDLALRVARAALGSVLVVTIEG